MSSNARAAIIAAARDQVERGGAFSVKEVAARAGVTRQAVHYHFGGAGGLREALAREGVAVPEPHAGTRERILQAAGDLLSLRGGDASVDAIAARAGVTKGAVYHHFRDRASLLRAVARRMGPVDEIQRALDGSGGLSDREQLLALARAYAGFISSRADLVRNLANSAEDDPELAPIVFDEILARVAPLAFGWLQGRIDAGVLRPVHPSLLIQAIVGAVGAQVLMGPRLFAMLRQAGVQPAAENMEAYVDMLLHGLATERWSDSGSGSDGPARGDGAARGN